MKKSADVPNIIYQGVEFNHQWSKSVEFEMLFRNYIKQSRTEDMSYFSLLRPYHEIAIIKKIYYLPTIFFNIFKL